VRQYHTITETISERAVELLRYLHLATSLHL